MANTNVEQVHCPDGTTHLSAMFHNAVFTQLLQQTSMVLPNYHVALWKVAYQQYSLGIQKG